MVSRRNVLVAGSACACAWTLFPIWEAAAQEEEEFICGTPEPPEFGVPEIEEMSADDLGGAGSIEEFIGTLKADYNITEYGTARLADTWRRGDGLTPNQGKITLGICFIDGSEAQRQAVKTHASKWLQDDLGRVIAFRWDVPQRQAQISITFDTNRNSSLIGRASRNVAKTQASMHLGQVHERTICHEFGHALGLRHEHSNPNSPIVWNKPAVIADMARQGWTEAMVASNIFRQFGPEYACIGDPEQNLRSVMMYPIPARWTLNGFSAGQTISIDEGDRRCLRALYSA